MLFFPLMAAGSQKLAAGLIRLQLRFLQRKTVPQRILQRVFLEFSIGCAECEESGLILALVYFLINRPKGRRQDPKCATNRVCEALKNRFTFYFQADVTALQPLTPSS